MDSSIVNDVQTIVINSVGGDLTQNDLNEDYQLAGNVLDSMAVTSLILSLEEHFGFTFDDADLKAESFQTLGSLYKLVFNKINATN